MNLIPQYVGNCRNQSSDLAILMGDRPEDELFGPESAYRKQYQNPAAYARLQNYDARKGWGKGLIWLHDGDPFQYINGDGKFTNLNFQKAGVVETLIMHEVGHVFGNGHISGTIMDEDLLNAIAADRVTLDRPSALGGLLAIDESQQLLQMAALEDFANKEGISLTMNAINFEKRFGQKPDAIIVADVKWPLNPAKSMTISVAAGSNEYQVAIAPTKTKFFSDNNNAFSYCLQPVNANEVCCGIKRYSFVQWSYVHWPSGLQELVSISHNLPDQSVGSSSVSGSPSVGYSRDKKRESIFSLESASTLAEQTIFQSKISH
ncbi:MAG: hypothetical protein NTV34_17475 [Proteobacteria bacterium]|nr:hypothetical protein [Pseudomonadota bacterium]